MTNPKHYPAARETVKPTELRAGDVVLMLWGWAEIESCEVTDDRYTMTTVPDAHGKRETVERMLGNYPERKRGNW